MGTAWVRHGMCELAFKEQHSSVDIGTAEGMDSTTAADRFQVWEINFSLLQSLKILGAQPAF
jgi:hypothetical protein